jgi:hypothetical protein
MASASEERHVCLYRAGQHYDRVWADRYRTRGCECRRAGDDPCANGSSRNHIARLTAPRVCDSCWAGAGVGERRRGPISAHLIVVTEASGAGTTTIVRALFKRSHTGVLYNEFDTIGISSLDGIAASFGPGDAFQAWARDRWCTRIAAAPASVRLAVLDAQVRPSAVGPAAARAGLASAEVVLVHATPTVRAAWLHGARQKPELDNPSMTQWAAVLAREARALGCAEVDTAEGDIADAVLALERVVLKHAALRGIG